MNLIDYCIKKIFPCPIIVLVWLVLYIFSHSLLSPSISSQRPTTTPNIGSMYWLYTKLALWSSLNPSSIPLPTKKYQRYDRKLIEFRNLVSQNLLCLPEFRNENRTAAFFRFEHRVWNSLDQARSLHGLTKGRLVILWISMAEPLSVGFGTLLHKSHNSSHVIRTLIRVVIVF